jgi:hypothetical protein
MKIGDLVKLCEEGYPQFKGDVGVLIKQDQHRFPLTVRGWWLLVLRGKIIQIHEERLEVINEDR